MDVLYAKLILQEVLAPGHTQLESVADRDVWIISVEYYMPAIERILKSDSLYAMGHTCREELKRLRYTFHNVMFMTCMYMYIYIRKCLHSEVHPASSMFFFTVVQVKVIRGG